MFASTATRRAGFTLLEMMIVTAVLVVVVLAVMGLMSATTDEFGTLAPVDQVQEAGRMAVDRMSEDMRASQSSSFVVTQNFVNPLGQATAASDVKLREVVTYSSTLPVVSKVGDTLVSSSGRTYQWTLSGANIAGATSQSYTVASAGSYSVTVPGSTPTVTTTKVLEYYLEKSNVDADANHVKDDWKLVRVDAGAKTTLCHYVKAGGLAVTLTGRTVVITLTMNVATTKRVVVQRALTSSIILRN